MPKAISREALEKRREDLLAKLTTAQRRSSQVIGNLGVGYAKRAYSRLKHLSFRREDQLKAQLEETEAALRALGWRAPGEAPPPTAAEKAAETMRIYRELMGWPPEPAAS